MIMNVRTRSALPRLALADGSLEALNGDCSLAVEGRRSRPTTFARETCGAQISLIHSFFALSGRGLGSQFALERVATLCGIRT